MINGYKLLKDTPLRDPMLNSDTDSINTHFYRGSKQNEPSSRFRLPETPLREELGHKIANEAQIRKREKKAREKFNHLNKIGLTVSAQESAGHNTVGNNQIGGLSLKSPLSSV